MLLIRDAVKPTFICINTTDYNCDNDCCVIPFTLSDATENGVSLDEEMSLYGDTQRRMTIADMWVGCVLVDNYHYGTFIVRIA